MTQHFYRKKNVWMLLPSFGAMSFIVLYFIATLFYPGGSQADKNATGFSWVNNYWCNLLNATAINGQHNPAKPIAIAGMFVLCVTLSFFWYLFPTQIRSGKFSTLLIQIPGVLAMGTAFLLLTDIDHDLVINLASAFGLIATAGVFTGLYKIKWYGLFAFGLLNLLLVGLNNYVYYNNSLIAYLPVIQKISFAVFLCWICCVNIGLYRRQIRNMIAGTIISTEPGD